MEVCHYWTQTFSGTVLTLVERNGALVVCAFGEDMRFIKAFVKQHLHQAHLLRKKDPLLFALKPLKEYFSGERKKFQVPVALYGTPFQMKVWNALTTIPFGETLAYGELAAKLGNRHYARAVGAACGANPVSIIVPCHRVVGASGKLTGYGGGIDTKRKLLQMEGNLLL